MSVFTAIKTRKKVTNRILDISQPFNSIFYGVIHKPCGQSRGRGVSEKTMFVYMGELGVRGLSAWTKIFLGDPFFVRINSNALLMLLIIEFLE